MSRTLFWYIFWDLLKIFGLASGAIAGILSFGGLLRPLTEHGLDMTQVGRIFSYFMPAMTTYSLPIAALFSTTVVYGRMAADHEIVACRASGISHLSIAMPALLLGLIVATVSLLILCFIVPTFLLRIEQVVYSNVADLVAHEIQRTHQVTLVGSSGHSTTIFAQDARTLSAAESRGGQAVVLIGPTVVTYEPDAEDKDLQVPRDFMMAQRATVYIQQQPRTGQLAIEVDLQGGTRFPREFAGSFQAGIENQPFRIERDSPIRFRPKFMTLFELKRTMADRTNSRKMQSLMRELAHRAERVHFVGYVMEMLNQEGQYHFTSGPTTISIERTHATATMKETNISLLSSEADHGRDVLMRESGANRQPMDARARRMNLSFGPVDQDHHLIVTLELFDVQTSLGGDTTARSSFSHSFQVAIPESMRYRGALTAERLNQSPYLSSREKLYLWVENTQLGDGILAELHSRASFAVSCLVLVMMGCGLGMIFKSGNFLSAFAVSVIPALLCITLIISGQHLAENVPWDKSHYVGPGMGLAMIWSGNAVTTIIAVALLWKLQKE